MHIELFALRRIPKFSLYLSRLDRTAHSRDAEARPAITSVRDACLPRKALQGTARFAALIVWQARKLPPDVINA